MLNIFIAYNIAKGEDFSVYNNVKEGSNICILQKSSKSDLELQIKPSWISIDEVSFMFKGSIRGIVATMAKMYNTIAYGPLAMNA